VQAQADSFSFVRIPSMRYDISRHLSGFFLRVHFMAKARLLLIVAVMAAFTLTSFSVASTGPVGPIQGPAPVKIVKKVHRKLHKRRRRHHRHHKKTVNTVFHKVKL
jgi:hypothetical protein